MNTADVIGIISTAFALAVVVGLALHHFLRTEDSRFPSEDDFFNLQAENEALRREFVQPAYPNYRLAEKADEAINGQEGPAKAPGHYEHFEAVLSPAKPSAREGITQEEVADRINLHPATPEMVPHFEAMRAEYMEAGRAISEHTPAGREQSLAMTALEESLMWATKSVAMTGPSNGEFS